MKLTVHTVVKNEDIWIWFALQSLLPFAEQIIVFDTGSSDKTVEVIKKIRSNKIIFENKGIVNKKGLVKLRQEQLERTKTDWFLILDGDEIWPKDQLNKLIQVASQSPKNTVAVFNRVRSCIGDIFHYLPDSAGGYEIAGMKGNLNIRLIKKTPQLKVTGEYPLETYVNQEGPIQSQNQKLVFGDCWYLHTSFLKRSSAASDKVSGSFGRVKYPQRGLVLNEEQLPSVFNESYPDMVPDPKKRRGVIYESLAQLAEPILTIKNAIKNV
jgi:glycosyltransferase involved in cell wall biosynthesis